MNILVLGWYYSSNLGDAVICDCVAELLRRKYPQANVVIRDMAGRTQFPPRIAADSAGIDRLRRRQKLRNAVTRMGWDKQLSHELWCLQQDLPRMDAVTDGCWDLAVFAGGQLFMDDLALYAAHLTQALQQKNVPVLFNACGTGPSCSPAVQQRLAAALTAPNVHLVSCRDNTGLVNRWCGSPVAVPTNDPALWAGSVYGIQKQPGNTVGIGVLYPRTLNPRATAASLRRLIAELENRGRSWMLFTNGSEQDMAFARMLLDGRAEQDYLCPAPETPAQLVQTIARFGSIIGFRLHSHIIAASLDIPTVALVWDRKLPLFFEKLGLKNRCFSIHDSASAIVSALSEAEASGCPRAAIHSRRLQARDLLTGTIDAL